MSNQTAVDIWAYRYESATGQGMDQIAVPIGTRLEVVKDRVAKDHPSWSTHGWSYLGREDREAAC